MDANKYDFSYSLGYLTIVSSRLFAALTNRDLARLGLDLTAEQWALLRLLLNEDGMTQDAILGITRYEKSSLSRLLDGMEKRELVRRERGKQDARRKYVFITPKGMERGETGTKLALDTLEKLYDGIPENDLATCREVLCEIQSRLLQLLRGEEP